MVAEGDVDTEVVVVAAALVGAGRGDQSVDGGRTDSRGLAPVVAEDAGVSVGCESAELTSGFSGFLPVGAPEPGPA